MTSGVTPRRGGRSARVVNAVLNATVEEISRSGYVGLTVEGVAERAGVNKTTIYRRWPTKVELVQAALQSIQHKMPLPDSGSLRDDLLSLAETWTRFINTPQGRSLAAMIESAGPQSELGMLVQRMDMESFRDCLKICERGIKRGELPPNADCDLMIILVGGYITHCYRHRKTPTRTALAHVVDTILAGAIAMASEGAPARRRGKLLR